MIALGGVVPQDRGLTPRILDYHVYVAVVIQVAERRAAAGELYRQTVTALVGHVSKFPFSRVHQDDVPGVVCPGVVELLDVVLDVPAGDEDVPISVVIKIPKAVSPCHV